MPRRGDLNLLDTKLFRAFLAAAEAENFTSAAKRAYMTQSGISQHIAKLEEQLGVPLFKRIGKSVALTDTGRRLQKFIKHHLYDTETFLDEIRSQHANLTGRVSYAMPASCLLSPHFSMLLEKRKAYPDITLGVTLTPSPDVLRLVMDDKVDFGFVTKKNDNPALEFRLFCNEEYILVGSDRQQIESINAGNICEQPHILYPGVDVYYGHWLQHHFPERHNLDYLSLSEAGNFNAIDGAIKMVQGGLGISIFPRHCVMHLLDTGELHEYPSTKPPLINGIYITTLAGHAYTRAVAQVIDWFFEMHCDG